MIDSPVKVGFTINKKRLNVLYINESRRPQIIGEYGLTFKMNSHYDYTAVYDSHGFFLRGRVWSEILNSATQDENDHFMKDYKFNVF